VKKYLITSLSIISIFSGCATTTLETSSKMTNTVFITPVSKDKKTIYLAFRNTSGQNINLIKRLNEELIAKGYKVIDEPEDATFLLMVNVLYCDKKMESQAGSGAVAGGATGALISGYNSNSTTNAVVSGIGGALVGGVVAGLLEDTIYQMQVDISIREKIYGKVISSKNDISGQTSVQDSEKSGFMNEFSGNIKNSEASGSLNFNRLSSDNQKYETNFIEHKTTIFAEATKMDLTLENAIPLLETKISTQIAGLF